MVPVQNRRQLAIEKSHVNDAYVMGRFQPRHRATPVYKQKKRRNNRCLERFYDAKVHRQPGWRKEDWQGIVQWPDQPEPQERFRKPAPVPQQKSICRQADDKEAALSDPAA